MFYNGNADTTMIAKELHPSGTDVAQDVTVDEFGVELERMLLEEQQQLIPTMSMPESPNHGDKNSVEVGAPDHEVLVLPAESGGTHVAQDVTLVDEFGIELERMLLKESMPESPNYGDKNLVEIGAPDHESLVPRPVVPAAESVGVTYHRKNKQWEAHLWLKGVQLRHRKKKGVQIFLGSFTTEDEAKKAHDMAAIKLDVRETARGKAYPLNFPEAAHAGYISEHADWSPRDFLWKLRRSSPKFNKGKSVMKGVTVRKAGRKSSCAKTYESKISQTLRDGEKTTFDLGKYASEEEAGEAYDRALLFLKGADELNCITNFQPSRYSAAEIQEAGKKLAAEMWP